MNRSLLEEGERMENVSDRFVDLIQGVCRTRIAKYYNQEYAREFDFKRLLGRFDIEYALEKTFDSHEKTKVIELLEKAREESSSKGRKLSITLISQSLNHFRDSNPKIRKWYNEKAEQNKAKGKIRMAICRKVFTEIYQMLKKNEYHYYRDEKNHLFKIEKYKRFLNNYKADKKCA